MIETGDLFVFIAALVAVYVLPGPDMALVLSASAFQGRRNGLMVAAGLASCAARYSYPNSLRHRALFSSNI